MKAAILKYDLDAKVVLFGTPAEESGGGKVEMIKREVFNKCDVCVMAHPACYDLPDPLMVAVSQFAITFKGSTSFKSTHEFFYASTILRNAF